MADQPLRPSVADDLGSLADLFRSGADGGAPAELAAGTVICEHFVIEQALGRGGMGVVYQALDRRLDRKVALKVDLRGADLARARREASALARLAHPNVVTIHEIGEHDGVAFVAMELCDGGTARTWVSGRRWRDVLGVYLDAGRGLAAAHAAGLVHRDVKPDNILLGADGRARIGDFGLARDVATLGPATPTADRGGDAAVTAPASAAPPPDGAAAATATHAVVGTPRYMAPEQRTGGVIDARADQFAFCVALYEALAGVEPFPDDSAARAAAITAARLAPPSRGHAAPRRVLQVLARGMRAEPAARWPSMDALLAALERAGRRRWPFAAAGLVLVALGAGTAWTLTQPPAGPPPFDPCVGVAADLAAVWQPGQRAAFVARHGQAPTTAAWTADVLDHFAATWTRARHTVCVTAPRDPAWSRDVLAKAVDCLTKSRDRIAQAVATGDVPPADLLAVTSGLWTPTCDQREVVALVRSPPPDADAAAREQAALAVVDQARAAEDAGRPDEARTLAARAVALAQDATPQARALAEQVLGRVTLAARGLDEAAGHFRNAYFEFRAISDGRETFATAFQLAQSYAAAGRLDDAAEWLAHARAEGARIQIAPSHLAMMGQVEALIARARGDHAAAVEANARGIAALEAAGDPVMRPNQIRALVTQATLLAEAGRLDESIAVARDTLTRQEQLLGLDHVDLLPTLANIGLGYADQGKLDEALPWLKRACDLGDRVYAPDALERAPALLSYGEALAPRDPAAAVPVLAEALRLVVKHMGADVPDAVDIRGKLAAARAAAQARPAALRPVAPR